MHAQFAALPMLSVGDPPVRKSHATVPFGCLTRQQQSVLDAKQLLRTARARSVKDGDQGYVCALTSQGLGKAPLPIEAVCWVQQIMCKFRLKAMTCLARAIN